MSMCLFATTVAAWIQKSCARPRFRSEGETTELDRKVIEALNDPLIHLIRNAVDHGIESPAEREALGKPRQGSIHVSAQSLGSYVHVLIRDDGRGMDPKKLREAAVQIGRRDDRTGS